MDVIEFGDLQTSPICLTIGNYDGLHRGHQRVIRQLRTKASEIGVHAGVLSFTPHPLALLAPDKCPRLIQTRSQKIALLEHYGIDLYVEQSFNRELAKTSPEAYVKQLVENLNLRALMVGKDFRFGHRRRGDADLLKRMSTDLDFEFVPIDEVEDGKGQFSSTRLRRAIGRGDVAAAIELTGRVPFIEGAIESGAQLGRGLGFPTANLRPDNDILPACGVYATWSRLEGQWYRSITNIGVRPTLHAHDALHVETHLLEFSGSIYGQSMLLAFTARIRDEIRFPNKTALIKQIKDDIQHRCAMPDTAAPNVPAPLGSRNQP